MKKLFALFLATLSLTACSTTKSNSLAPNLANAESSRQQVCIYTQRIGWHLKQKNCMSKEAYIKNNVSPMPTNSQSQSTQRLSVDQLPNSGK